MAKEKKRSTVVFTVELDPRVGDNFHYACEISNLEGVKNVKWPSEDDAKGSPDAPAQHVPAPELR